MTWYSELIPQNQLAERLNAESLRPSDVFAVLPVGSERCRLLWFERSKTVLIDDSTDATGASDWTEIKDISSAGRLLVGAEVSAGTPNVIVEGRQEGETSVSELANVTLGAASNLRLAITDHGIFDIRVRWTGNTGTLRAVATPPEF